MTKLHLQINVYLLDERVGIADLFLLQPQLDASWFVFLLLPR